MLLLFRNPHSYKENININTENCENTNLEEMKALKDKLFIFSLEIKPLKPYKRQQSHRMETLNCV